MCLSDRLLSSSYCLYVPMAVRCSLDGPKRVAHSHNPALPGTSAKYSNQYGKQLIAYTIM